MDTLNRNRVSQESATPIHPFASLTLKTPSRSKPDGYGNHATPQTPGLPERICLVGTVGRLPGVVKAAESFGLPVFESINGQEFIERSTFDTVFILEDFECPEYEYLYSQECRIMGYPAMMECAEQKYALPELGRPLFCTSMCSMVLCFTGFRRKEEVNKLIGYIHHMGGSIRKDFGSKITHLVASTCGGEKYRYAVTLGIPVMGSSWICAAWDRRKLEGAKASDDILLEHRLKAFHGIVVCLLGFSPEEAQRMTDILTQNGGTVSTLDDPNCTHVVVEEGENPSLPTGLPSKARVVKAEWFWASVQMDACVDEKMYLFNEASEIMSPRHGILSPSTSGTPGSAGSFPRTRKRKRIKETVWQLANGGNLPAFALGVGAEPAPASSTIIHKRRSSISEAGMLSMSGSFLDTTTSPEKAVVEAQVSAALPVDLKSMTPRQQVFGELLQTENNYVNILHTIMKVYKEPLEDPEQRGGPLLDPTETKMIFGHLPPIVEVHSAMLEQLKAAASQWREDVCVGNIILTYSQDLLRAYPPFVNFFEKTKEVLSNCDRTKPRFHAFLKIGQSRPECGRQSLQELLIRPVQRLPSISLLLNDLIKQTQKNHPDHAALEKALATIKEVMTHINEDKRKTEGQMVLFDIFNGIENCPAHLVSSHRGFISKCDVVELGGGIVGRGGLLTLFLFTDVLEICKRRTKTLGSLKSPSTVNLAAATTSRGPGQVKHYKHVELISLPHVKRVVDIRETEDCQKVFALICRSHQEIKERLYSFAIASEDVEKSTFLRTLCRHTANTVCRADAENYLTCLDAHQLDIDTRDVATGTLGRAARLASKTRMVVNRAFSFNKTPNRLKRAVSSMMSPFHVPPLGPSNENVGMGVAACSTLAASCTNLADIGSTPTTGAQAAKKVKGGSLGVSAFRQL